MKKTILILSISLMAFAVEAQTSLRVLFVGNSYTEVNDLPSLIHDFALAASDTLVYQSNTPGGCTFSQHCQNQSMQLIRAGGWDYVVLQEQSQMPAFPESQVAQQCMPYAEALVDSIYRNSVCATPVFYQTWGRKYGDPQNGRIFPPIGTYEGMDSLLFARYSLMADSFDAALCPVGRVWRYIRANMPDIELYQSDDSHPTLEGSYAAAAAFYALIFGRDPEPVAYDAGLDSKTASRIRSAVRAVVFDSLARWQRQPLRAKALYNDFGFGNVVLQSRAHGVDQYTYSFDPAEQPLTTGANAMNHRYLNDGTYEAWVAVSRTCTNETDTARFTIQVTGLAVDDVLNVDFEPDDVVTVFDALGRTLYEGRFGNVYNVGIDGVLYIRRDNETKAMIIRR